MPHSLLTASVYHKRHTPLKNAFTYGVYYVDIPVREPAQSPCTLFSYNRFNILSLYTHDRGYRDTRDWSTWVEDLCSKHGTLLEPSDTIRLITHPRLFGYAFNPISFWLILDSYNTLRTVICEVNNTFGDNHSYVVSHPDRTPMLPSDTFRVEKNLYVSPFNTMQGHYFFSFSYSSTQFSATINYHTDDAHILTAAVSGRLSPLTNRSILWAVIRYPLMTFMVVARIHLQAIKLWFRKLPHTLHLQPPVTTHKTTRVTHLKEQ